MLLRRAYTPDPAHPQGDTSVSLLPQHRIAFCHPGYPDRVSILFTLHAPDHPTGGLHYDTAHLACAVVAGNRWDGFFTETTAPSDPVSSPVLRARRYYFHVPGYDTKNPYPVVPRFAEWTFPHNQLPASWVAIQPDPAPPTRVRSSNSAYVQTRDSTCRLSGHEDGTETAHLIPRSEDGWFHRNGMERYILNSHRSGFGAVDDPTNIILLRSDLHHVFDKARVTFVPKSESDNSDINVVAHVLDGSRGLIRLYHNVALLPLTGVAVEFLFARFVWSVFSFLQGFLCANVPRMLLSQASPVDDSSTARLFTGQECRDLIDNMSRSRSISPKKRHFVTENTDDAADGASNSRKRICRSSSASPSPDPQMTSFDSSQYQLSDPTINAPWSSSSHAAICPPSTLNHLVKEHLDRERERSDPHHTWAKECQWARGAMTRPLSAAEVQRWYAAQGFDLLNRVNAS